MTLVFVAPVTLGGPGHLGTVKPVLSIVMGLGWLWPTWGERMQPSQVLLHIRCAFQGINDTTAFFWSWP